MKTEQPNELYEDDFEDSDEHEEIPDKYTNYRRNLKELRTKKKRKTKKKAGSPPRLSQSQIFHDNKPSHDESNGDIADNFHNKETKGLPVVEGFDPRKNNKMATEEAEGKRMVCSECAMVGHFSAVDDRVKKVIKHEYGKTSSFKSQGRCVICFKESNELQVLTPEVEAAMKSIAYSHTFYDKFSRESKVPDLETSKSHLPPIEEGKPVTDSNKKTKKKHGLPVKSYFPTKDQEFPREQQNETTRISTSQFQPLQQKKSVTIATPQKADPFFENFNVSRGMKGSVLRKDKRVRPLGKLAKDIDYTMYSVGSLGLLYQLPENNHSIIPDSVFKASSLDNRPHKASNFRPFSLLPPVKAKRRPLSYSHFSI